MNQISKCPGCSAIFIKDILKPFHQKNCEFNEVSVRDWDLENNRRNLKLFNSFNNEIKHLKWADTLSKKELANYLIEHYYGIFKAGTKNDAVLNKVIQILFDLD